MNPTLRVDSLTKCFGDIEALIDVSLEVKPDELLVILGPTGAGKTTLLRTICGLESPDEGTIQIGERDITHAMPAERDIALVFQNFSLYPDWSVRENITFPLRAPGRNHTEKEIGELVSWAANILKISHLLDREATKLSGGEMQRVAIGRAIVRRPALFLMDEPLTNLDAKLRESLRVELVTLRRELGTPMIFVTHDQVEAMSMGDRIAVLNHGRILQEGGPESVYSHPVSPEVALQLGSPPINIIRAAREANSWVARDGTILMAAARHPDSGTATIGFRPEDLKPDGGTSPGEVLVVEHMGASVILVVSWAGQEVHMTVPKFFDVRVGDVLYPKVTDGKSIVWS